MKRQWQNSRNKTHFSYASPVRTYNNFCMREQDIHMKNAFWFSSSAIVVLILNPTIVRCVAVCALLHFFLSWNKLNIILIPPYKWIPLQLIWLNWTRKLSWRLVLHLAIAGFHYFSLGKITTRNKHAMIHGPVNLTHFDVKKIVPDPSTTKWDISH